MDLDNWNAWTPAQIADGLEGVHAAWAVAGGWAIDLFSGSEPRLHGDLDVVTTQRGREEIRTALPLLDWYAAHDGKLAPISTSCGAPSTSCGAPLETRQVWGWDTSVQAWRVDVMAERWEDDHWWYRRNPAISAALTTAIHATPSGIPFLAPEIVLLFKAKHARAGDERDFEVAVPLMTDGQRHWLATALEIEHPDHHWRGALAT